VSRELRILLAVVGIAAVVLGLRSVLRPRRPDTPAGVNVVGYLGATSGLGERARELVACLRAAGIPVSEWSADADDRPPPEVRATTIAVVTAVQLASVRDRLPLPFAGARRTIGYFFWELQQVPDEQQWGIGLVDEIWVPTTFVRDAYAAATERPVRLAPLPVAAPPPVVHAAAPLGDGEFTFLCSFDHLSVMERKNPIGAVDAFRRAFPAADPDTPPVRLVVKSIHGDRRPSAVARLEAAIGDDARIEIRDEHLDAPDQLALIESADALVSLHRSEGLGLHLAEAMWLGTPVLATGYSGNLDLMDESCAALVRYELTRVEHGDDAYPDTAEWADPDLDHAVELMRRLVRDGDWREALVAAARARMAAQPSRAEAGARLAALIGPSVRG
jgi:glycosyltransferase involved in cell wall biosynthesis